MIMNIIFLALALLGALLAFGPTLLDAGLAGMASIDFVSGMDAIVFGLMMAILVCVCAYSLFVLKGHKETVRNIRIVSWIVIGLVLITYAILVCSIWADSWLVGYRAWTAASANGLQIACYAGWLCMVCSGGWMARAIYEWYVKEEAKKPVGSDK